MIRNIQARALKLKEQIRKEQNTNFERIKLGGHHVSNFQNIKHSIISKTNLN